MYYVIKETRSNVYTTIIDYASSSLGKPVGKIVDTVA